MNSPSSHRILLVDDEPDVLDGLCRQHRRHFTLVPARGPEAALEALDEEGPFAVVVSDFKMPGMNGAELLAHVHKFHRDTVRVMLTGHSDLSATIDAVNRGNLFRFLTKPCPPDDFREVLYACIEQYDLVQGERRLLSETVRGSVEVLTEVLALANPVAFGRARRLQGFVQQMVAALELTDSWQYETAALLSQIGCVAVPDDVFERLGRGEELPPEELGMLERHPELAHDLLRRIPRLQKVAEMVRYHTCERRPSAEVAPNVWLGSRVLAAATRFDELLALGARPEQAVDVLRSEPRRYGVSVLEALARVDARRAPGTQVLLQLRQLRPGMVLAEEVRDREHGRLILPLGHELTDSSLSRLRNFGELGLLKRSEFSVHVAEAEGERRDPSAA